MTHVHHRPTCHHKNGDNKVRDAHGNVIGQCRCICTCPSVATPEDYREEQAKPPKPYQDLRGAFFKSLIALAEKDETIVLVIPDVGFSFTEEFQRRFPKRYFNTGVTEQSTMVLCAGLALSGLKPYYYTMINFSVFRPYEQLRNAVCYHNANVKVLGVKGSEKYKFLGFSHNIVENEDFHAVQMMPNIQCHKPVDEAQVAYIMEKEYERVGPAYIRL